MSRWLHAQVIQYPESANGTLIILDDCSSAEEVDLFNNMQNIVITNTERGVWQQIGKVNLNAHSPNPGAPEHLAMVNNLLGDNAKNKHIHDASNLGKISQAQWRGLREHVLTLSHPMTRCCFQCGMLNHPVPKGLDIIIVEDIHEMLFVLNKHSPTEKKKTLPCVSGVTHIRFRI